MQNLKLNEEDISNTTKHGGQFVCGVNGHAKDATTWSQSAETITQVNPNILIITEESHKKNQASDYPRNILNSSS